MDNKVRNYVIVTALSVFIITAVSMFMYTQTEQEEGLEQIAENIAVADAQKLIEEKSNDPNFILLDVRTPEEFRDGHIENAVNIDFYSDTFNDDIAKLDKEKTYLIYCASGRRSGIATDSMKELGFKEAYNMEGGIAAYTREGHKIVR